MLSLSIEYVRDFFYWKSAEEYQSSEHNSEHKGFSHSCSYRVPKNNIMKYGVPGIVFQV